MFSSSPSQVERQRPGSADRRRHSQDNVPREDRGSDDGASSGHSGLFVSDDDRFASPSEPVAKPVPQPRRFAPFEVQVPAVKRRKAYVDYHDELVVSKVIKEAFSVNGQVTYEVRCGDGERVMLPYTRLLRRPNGPSALSAFNEASDSSRQSDSEMSEAMSSSHRRQAGARRARPSGFVDIDTVDIDEDDGITMSPPKKSRGKRRGTGLYSTVNPRAGRTMQKSSGNRRTRRSISSSPLGGSSPEVTRTRAANTRSMRSQIQTDSQKPNYAGNTILLSDDDEGGRGMGSSQNVRRSASTNSLPFVVSDLYPPTKAELARMKNWKGRGNGGGRSITSKRRKFGRTNGSEVSDGSEYENEIIVRRSGRSGKPAVNMRERGEDDIWASDDDDDEAKSSAPRAVGVREVFRELPRSDSFRNLHCQWCDSCGQYGSSKDRGPLIFCQGCTVSYHRICLGVRQQREHLVSKVGDQNFVMQCRRCVRMAEKRDALAPRQDRCQACREIGVACVPFRERKTTRQEQKEREENDGQDPIVEVDVDLLNNTGNLLFRCTSCQRGFHFEHLPPLGGSDQMDTDTSSLAEIRYAEYCEQWKCLECINMPAEVQGFAGWRPVDVGSYQAGATVEMVPEDEKEYLIKWKKLSYFRSTWMPGAWTWGVTMAAMRKAYAKRENGFNLPKMTTDDAIPEEFYRVDAVLDVRYTSIVSIHTEEIDKARIREVDKALVKYKGLPYEEVVWEKPPRTEDGERWDDFVVAYEDWVAGRYIHLPKQKYLQERCDRARSLDFQEKLLKKKQPENLTGGEMMGYQMEGLNWAYYKWYKQQNAILADEMGLGKTIQIIGLLATLVQDHKCWPFLIVVPNSTCPNWRREIKHWAPSLRVVTYYGSSEARKLAMDHELYPDGSKDLKCHIVVTSYEAPGDDKSKKFFRDVPWAGLIVDEGQRLKNDKNQLYETLSALVVPFKILMTGTPLQNNARELFNLLQFLDPNIKASEMEAEYAELTKENVPKLHDLIRPFFLRRTKAQVLTFLPPMAQIIIPVTMSVLQKKLYRSILARSPELIRSIYGRQKLKQTERHNLNNILMQLRKCLCHPFVYSQAIEERDVSAANSHRTLVEASSKLQLLDIMLPKLQERGHRVLIFSQFLGMLDIIEDFLDGLGLSFGRLDGSIGSLQKQKRIDAFNAPNSTMFAFLLSTRAGGVGINLATADTVIIMDPDFNPHQDIQALSRAHRIGQQKKVLVFQLMTRESAEEKIVQVGRKKMALDHVLVEQMDAEEDAGVDLESILLHGAAALFDEDDKNDIHYDSASVDKLLDRSQAENTKTGDDSSAESQFSYARVWANDHNQLEDGFKEAGDERMPDPTVWDKILREREHQAALERAAKQQTFGRGKRKRQTVEYSDARTRQLLERQILSDPDAASSPPALNGDAAPADDDDESNSDTDFEVRPVEESDNDTIPDERAHIDPNELAASSRGPGGLVAAAHPHYELAPPAPVPAPSFHRAKMPLHPPPPPPNPGVGNNPLYHAPAPCVACSNVHPVGFCPLKLAGAEKCPLCGIAHFGEGPVCPHLKSETQVRKMMEALKKSPENTALKEAAMTYLRGRKGHLVRVKKEEEKKKALQQSNNQGRRDSTVSAVNGDRTSRRGSGMGAKMTAGKTNGTSNGVPAGSVTVDLT